MVNICVKNVKARLKLCEKINNVFIKNIILTGLIAVRYNDYENVFEV